MDPKLPSVLRWAFHSLTPSYDTVCELVGYGRALKRRLLDRMQPQAGQRVLDVGAGTGTFLVELFQRVPRVTATGIDPDAAALTIAARKLEPMGDKVQLVPASADQLPFNDGTFDWVVSTLVFHHLPPAVKRRALREIYRVLKPGGSLLLADIGRARNRFEWLLLRFLSWFDGQANVRENIDGVLPHLVERTGFSVTDDGPRYRFINFLLAKKLVA